MALDKKDADLFYQRGLWTSGCAVLHIPLKKACHCEAGRVSGPPWQFSTASGMTGIFKKEAPMNAIGMHYGFWSHNWNEIDYYTLIPKIARLGFDVSEVASAEFAYYSDDKLKELKQLADDNGLTFTYSIGLEAKYDLASDDASVRENGIRQHRAKEGRIAKVLDK
jgi:hypothetical protein